MRINAQLKSLFLDRPAIKSATNAAEKKALTRTGAYVRRVARNSIRKATRKTSKSQPGEPVREQTSVKGQRYKEGIVFYYDKAKHDVLIINAARGHRDSLPAIHEVGGTATVTPRKPVRTLSGVVYAGDKLPPIRVRIEPRPVLALALVKAKPKLLEFWRGSFKK